MRNPFMIGLFILQLVVYFSKFITPMCISKIAATKGFGMAPLSLVPVILLLSCIRILLKRVCARGSK